MEDLIVMLNYKIVIGDSRNMSEVESDTVQLVVTSPPYWYLVTFSEEGEVGWEKDLSRIRDKTLFFKELTKVWKECFRVMKAGGYLVCEWEDIPVGSWNYGYPNEIFLGDMVKSIEDANFVLISRWFWRKFETGAILSKFQYALHSNLVRSDPRAIANVAYCFVFKKRNGSRPAVLDFTKEEWKVWCDGLWYIENPPASAEGLASGAAFPEELVRRFIKIYSSPNDLVCDPFLGTGTTMKVAFDQDRSCVGYEVMEKMLQVIKDKVHFGRQKISGRVGWEIKR